MGIPWRQEYEGWATFFIRLKMATAWPRTNCVKLALQTYLVRLLHLCVYFEMRKKTTKTKSLGSLHLHLELTSCRTLVRGSSGFFLYSKLPSMRQMRNIRENVWMIEWRLIAIFNHLLVYICIKNCAEQESINGVEMRIRLSAQRVKHKSHMPLGLLSTLWFAKLNWEVHARRADVPCLDSSSVTMLARYLACAISAEVFCWVNYLGWFF